MSWTGDVVHKVGHYLSHSSDKVFRKGGTQQNHEDLRSNARCHAISEVSEQAPSVSSLITTTEPWEHHCNNKEQGHIVCARLSCDESREHDQSNVVIAHKSESNEFALNSALHPPSKLPPMSDDSALLSEDFRAFIYSALPTVAKDRHWIMLYSTARHGISMRTLYQKCALLSEPYLLVAREANGATFGGLATASLKPTAQRKYVGTSDTFVFTNRHKEFKLYKATGSNRYYLLCTNDAIAFGGGGHFAIYIEESLLRGSSGSCDTFGNECLATSLEFSVCNLEVWGYAHIVKQP